MLPAGVRLKELKIYNKSIDIRYYKNNPAVNHIVVRYGLYLPSDENKELEIGFYNVLLEKNGKLVDEFFELS